MIGSTTFDVDAALSEHVQVCSLASFCACVPTCLLMNRTGFAIALSFYHCVILLPLRYPFTNELSFYHCAILLPLRFPCAGGTCWQLGQIDQIAQTYRLAYKQRREDPCDSLASWLPKPFTLNPKPWLAVSASCLIVYQW